MRVGQKVGKACVPAVFLLMILVVVACDPVTAPQADQFYETTVFQGLTNPTVVRFASDGRVFVAEKRGIIKVFDSLSDTTPTIFADLRTKVYNYWDRGLLGMTLDPGFPSRPYIYVTYAYDGAIGGSSPRWGTPGQSDDPCPTPPGPTDQGCVVSGRVSRLRADGNVMSSEQVLLSGWCQQFPSHSIGSLAFGNDGALYMSAGEGASFEYADWGQTGNPCGDPPGGSMTPPTAEGGSLRAQDIRTSGDATGLSGAVLRLDPNTGAAMTGNPNGGSSDANARRIVAYGLRNPFRFTIRPGTNELWLGDVGAGGSEEIDRIPDGRDSVVENFGWPCYEGLGRNGSFNQAGLNLCNSLYANPGAVTAPYSSYAHASHTVANDPCGTSTAAISGLAFYNSGSYPTAYNGALFFTDYARNCMWVMQKGANGLPDPGTLSFFRSVANPVYVTTGPGGDLFYLDFLGGRVQRISFDPNRHPIASYVASPTAGPAPTTVNFDASASSDPEGDSLTYAWDLDGDGAYDDATGVRPSFTYRSGGVYNTKLRVTDQHGGSGTTGQSILINNDAPQAVIDTPGASLHWRVGNSISFSGHATDAQQGTLPASALRWSLLMHHCPAVDACHVHTIQNYPGVSSGSFVAPDHAYPSYLELQLKATDATGLTSTASVRLDPATVQLTVRSNPAGAQVTAGEFTGTTPFVRTVIAGSSVALTAPSPTQIGGSTYVFGSWSDGGARSHPVDVPSDRTYTANYSPAAGATPPRKDGTFTYFAN